MDSPGPTFAAELPPAGRIAIVGPADAESITAYESALAIEELDAYKAIYANMLQELYQDQGNDEKAAEMAALYEQYDKAGPDQYGLNCDE